jgi:hypothetical protein
MMNSEFEEKEYGQRGNHTGRNQQVTFLGICAHMTPLLLSGGLYLNCEHFSLTSRMSFEGGVKE